MSFLKKDLIKYEPRIEQSKVKEFIFNVKEKKAENKFFLLNLPTGVGKSHLAIMIADEYLTKIDKNCKIDIITAGKLLQDQYADSYQSISNLKGKENYYCTKYSCSCSQGIEFNRLNKSGCDFCEYDSARQSFITGKLSLTNFYLYLIYAVYNPSLLRGRESKLLIVDEAHVLDEVMSDFISVKVSENTLKRLKFNNEKTVLSKFNKVDSLQSYITFLEYLEKEINITSQSLEASISDRNAKLDQRDLRLSNLLEKPNDDLKIVQIISDLKTYGSKIKIFLDEYRMKPENWVMETNYSEKLKLKELSLEPIWSADYLDKYVWSHYDMVILMSGTILNKEIFSKLNGLDFSNSVYYSITSPFPVENRPIFYLPSGKMSFTKKEETFQRYIPIINKLLNKYKNKKGIIHTNSFELSAWINNSIKNGRLLFHDSDNQASVLEQHFKSESDTVIVSPSLHTGVSFDDSKARFQIIAKIPYPSLASQKNKLRQKTDPDWYAWRTCVNLVQAMGRINRSRTDFGETIILDESFSDVLKYSSKYIPDWIQAAIRRVKNS
jgi:Rad3-related DNA helicase